MRCDDMSVRHVDWIQITKMEGTRKDAYLLYYRRVRNVYFDMTDEISSFQAIWPVHYVPSHVKMQKDCDSSKLCTMIDGDTVATSL